jgi:hypothetical protein
MNLNHTTARFASIKLPLTSLPNLPAWNQTKERPVEVFIEGRTEPQKDGKGPALLIWRS